MSEGQQLLVTLAARVDKYERDIARARERTRTNFRMIEKQAETTAAKMQKAMAGALQNLGGTALGAAGIGGLGVAGLFAGAKSAAADIATLAAEAQKAGVAVEAFQELGYAAQQSLVGVDALTDGLKELQLRADEFIVTGAGSGAEAFQRLGYSADELKAKLADPAALFEDVIERLGRLDKAAQIRISDEIFGGTGGEQFVRMLKQGNGYIARMRQEARDTGNVLDSELVQRAIEIDRQFAKLSTTVGSNLKGALVGVVALMRDFSDMLRTTENQSASTLQRRIDLINAAVENARKSSLAFLAIGGDAGISDRLAERDQLQKQLDSRPGTSITVNPAPGGMGDLSKIQAPATKAADELQKAYQQLTQAAEQRIGSLNVETATVGMATREAARFRMEQDLIAEAQRAGITLTDAQRQQIATLAAAYGDAAAAAEAASTRFDNAANAKQFFADTGMEAVKGFALDLKEGARLTDALGNALGRLGDRLLDLGLDMALTPFLNTLSGGLTGALGFSTGGAVPHFATGGHVRGAGTGTSDSIPAMLSNGEFVVRADATARHRALLETINSGASLPAFATGGQIGQPPVLRQPEFGMRQEQAAQPITINAPVTVNGSAGTPEQNADLAHRMAKSMEATMRGVIVDELRKQKRPGNMLNNRGQ